MRTEAEFNEGHLQKAINIPYTEIQERIKEYVKDPQERIALYCRGGHRAGIAKEKLEEIG